MVQSLSLYKCDNFDDNFILQSLQLTEVENFHEDGTGEGKPVGKIEE